MPTMNALPSVLRRELRVAFSLRAQPLWFRIAKWLGFLAYVVAFRGRAWFWPVIGVCTVGALALHFLYRWQTRGWTRPWGGWDDLAAGRS